MKYTWPITPSSVDYTVGQLALLQASGNDVGALAAIYADAVAENDEKAEVRIALKIEDDYNRIFFISTTRIAAAIRARSAVALDQTPKTPD